MSDMDFSDLGREIEEKIKKIATSQEMKELQANIHMAVDKTIKEVRRSAQDAVEYINENLDARRESFQEEKRPEQQDGPVNQNNAGKQSGPENIWFGRNGVSRKKRQLPVIKKPTGRALGVLLSLTGTCGAVITWAVVLAALFMTLWGSGGGMLAMLPGTVFAEILSAGMTAFGVLFIGLAAALASAFTAAGIAGDILRHRARRFKQYRKVIGREEFCPVEKLSQATGKNKKYVVKDLKRMIRRRWFREGHFDDQETCFILTDETYQLYLNARAELQQRKEEEERQRKEREMVEQDPVRRQLKITVEEGKEYIRRIRKVNNMITGEVISGKMYRLERICTRIFEYIQDKPEMLDDIRKFMDYYLPTTLKLVETYYEFSVQPVRGENITTAQREIEEMLDNINLAFEKLYDKLFEDSAMDISTDISVLSTMLAQEGLLDNDFK